LSERADGSDQEHFGEADLGEAQADDAALDPEMVDDAEGPATEEELSDVPAIEPDPSTPVAIEETELAREEAGSIGGHTPAQDIDPAEQAVSEAGGGESEGFEQAEEELIESASHGDSSGNPLGDRYPAEEAATEGLSIYGEADDAQATEDTDESE
jgi:hypothetical protein